MPEKLYTYNFLWPGQDSRTSHFANWVRGKNWRETRRPAIRLCAVLAGRIGDEKNKQAASTCEAIMSCTPRHSRRCRCPCRRPACALAFFSPKLVVFSFLSLFAPDQQQQMATALTAAATKRGVEVREAYSIFYFSSCANLSVSFFYFTCCANLFCVCSSRRRNSGGNGGKKVR